MRRSQNRPYRAALASWVELLRVSGRRWPLVYEDVENIVDRLVTGRNSAKVLPRRTTPIAWPGRSRATKQARVSYQSTASAVPTRVLEEIVSFSSSVFSLATLAAQKSMGSKGHDQKSCPDTNRARPSRSCSTRFRMPRHC